MGLEEVKESLPQFPRNVSFQQRKVSRLSCEDMLPCRHGGGEEGYRMGVLLALVGSWPGSNAAGFAELGTARCSKPANFGCKNCDFILLEANSKTLAAFNRMGSTPGS